MSHFGGVQLVFSALSSLHCLVGSASRQHPTRKHNYAEKQPLTQRILALHAPTNIFRVRLIEGQYLTSLLTLLISLVLASRIRDLSDHENGALVVLTIIMLVTFTYGYSTAC